MAISSPNYTQFPNELLDDWQGRLDPSEFCVLAYIARHTFGWKREPVSIRYKDFIHGRFAADGARIDHGCGVKSSATITKAINHLLDLDLIRAYPTATSNGARGTTYYEVAVADDAAHSLRAVSGSLVAKEPAIQQLKSGRFSNQSAQGALATEEPIDKAVKETDKETDKETMGGASAPRRSKRPSLSPISTEDDPQADPTRRLALKWAREALGASKSTEPALSKYDAFFAARLNEGATEDDCLGFCLYADSGNHFWRGKSYLCNDTTMGNEWSAYVAAGMPDEKPRPRQERPRTAGGRLLDPAEIAARSSQGEL